MEVVSSPIIEENDEFIECRQVLSNSSNLRRHIKRVHLEVRRSLIKNRTRNVHYCEPCNKIFKDKFSLKRHLKSRIHTGRDPSEESNHFCYLCNKCYSDAYSYTNHMKRQHSVSTEKLCFLESKKSRTCLRDHQYPKKFLYGVNLILPSKTKNKSLMPLDWKKDKCSLCELSSERYNLLNHFREDHKIEIQEAKYTFNSMEEFFQWKKTYEKETNSKFIKVYNVLRNECIYKGYKCHLSRSLRIRTIRNSIKIGGYCPASIQLKKNDFDKYDVHVVETHVGHVLDIRHLNLVSSKGKKSTQTMQHIQRQHNISLNMDLNLVTCTDDGWNVLSKDLKQLYVVQKIQENCECDLKCFDCQGCAHQYICSCIDSSIKYNICMHIHLICRHTKNQNTTSTTASIKWDSNESCDIKEYDDHSTQLSTIIERYPSVEQQSDAYLAEDITSEEDYKEDYPCDIEENDVHLIEMSAIEEQNQCINEESNTPLIQCIVTEDSDAIKQENMSDLAESVAHSTENSPTKNNRIKTELLKKMRKQLIKEIVELQKRVEAEDPDEVLAIQRCIASIKSKLNGL